MWRSISASVAGPSHEKTGAPCQDSCLTRELSRLSESSLVACVADGAGSGSRSDDGSRLACEAVVELATAYYDAHQGSFEGLTEEEALAWCREARFRIEQLADLRSESPREYATTLCLACLSPGHAAFLQIGDGAIVARRGGVLGVVFWPHSGEYANTTVFLTGDPLDRNLRFAAVEGDFADVALLTDGIERLALSFEQRTPHAPFFDPLFNVLRSAADPAALAPELARLLDSDSMKSRSDDDKTVVLAAQAAAR
ncbi:PP2C family serine/threonine-protein phosphatase [Botrimarina sp.]|uniref:PP2C family serine/threonine-protein phosphatase n=1 Tax=Botrimarina sp. TaxID=2795802 RepID=UPI0032EC8A10